MFTPYHALYPPQTWMCLLPPATPHLSTQLRLLRHSATYRGKPPVSSCLRKYILFYCRPTLYYFIHLFSHLFANLFVHSFLISLTTQWTAYTVQSSVWMITALHSPCAGLYQPQIAVTAGADRPYIYRVIHKSLRDFRTRLRNNQDRHGRKEHINR